MISVIGPDSTWRMFILNRYERAKRIMHLSRGDLGDLNLFCADGVCKTAASR